MEHAAGNAAEHAALFQDGGGVGVGMVVDGSIAGL